MIIEEVEKLRNIYYLCVFITCAAASEIRDENQADMFEQR